MTRFSCQVSPSGFREKSRLTPPLDARKTLKPAGSRGEGNLSGRDWPADGPLSGKSYTNKAAATGRPSVKGTAAEGHQPWFPYSVVLGHRSKEDATHLRPGLPPYLRLPERSGVPARKASASGSPVGQSHEMQRAAVQKRWHSSDRRKCHTQRRDGGHTTRHN